MRKTCNICEWGVLPIVVLAVLVFAATRAQAQSDEVLTLDIRPQEASSALMHLARTSGRQIVLAAQEGANVEVEGLKGEYRLEDALAALLTGTGLAYELNSQDVIVVQEEEQEAEPETDDEAPSEDEEDPLELEAQVVTGSRLATGDPTARVYSYSAEDIAIRGVSTLEEFFRTLHWAVPSMTTQNNTALFVDSEFEKPFGYVNVGVSTINLRHMGSANTLVLLDGRRIAGVAGDFDNVLNLLNVPLSAIERVDIQLDGASAVYGSDAIGGVVNFITRKGFRGGSVNYREESSSTDADRRSLSVRGGFGWRTGNMSATLSRRSSEPINHLNLWTTRDWRPEFGPEFDRRTGLSGQPGVVCRYNGDPFYPQCVRGGDRMALPPGHSGVGATPEDFSDAPRSDLFWPENGADSTRTSLSLYLEQYITDGLRLYADVLVSRHDGYQARDSRMWDFVVPASNAYNPFGEHVVVNYNPWREIQSGILEPAHLASEREQRTFSVGLFWEFGDGHQLEVNAARSESESSSWVNWYRYRRSYHDPSAHRLYEALASPDPDKALNLFGDGTVQGSLATDLFSYDGGPVRSFTDLTRFEPLLRGQLFRVWGGAIEYALGAEYRRFGLTSYQTRYQEGGLERDTSINQGWLYDYGTERPTEEMQAYFFELAIPLIGSDNDRPGLRSLVLSIQARHDTHKMEGAAGGRDPADWEWNLSSRQVYVPGEGWQSADFYNLSHPFFDESQSTAIIAEARKSATSPRLGVRYSPAESFTLRAAWSRSFAPPNFSDVFNPNDERDLLVWYRDPYHPDGDAGWTRYPTVINPHGLHLKPESSDNYSMGFDWSPESLPGLRWTLDWSLVDFTDKIVSGSVLLNNFREHTFALPEFVQRDEGGYITTILRNDRNIAEKRSEMVHTHLQYTFDTRAGSFVSGLNYTRVLDEYYRILPTTEKVSRLGKVWGSNKYRLTGSLSWKRGRLGADMFVHYTPGYLNDGAGRCHFRQDGRCPELNGNLPELDVDALTTVDLTLTYGFDNGLQLRAGGRNIFLARSPTVLWRFQYDPTRWDARGRVLFLELNWEI